MRYLIFFLTFLTTLIFSQEQFKKSVLSISSTGKISAKPDIAELRITIIVEDSIYTLCLEKLTKKTNSLTDQLKSIKIPTKEIKTTDMNIRRNLVYDHTKQKDINKGFIASHYLKIKVENSKDMLNNVFNALSGSLAEADFNLNFEISNKEKYVEMALKEAIKNAKDKAIFLSKESGVKLLNINKIDYNYFQEEAIPLDRINNMMVKTATMNAGDGLYNYEAEEVIFRQSVNIEWNIQ